MVTAVRYQLPLVVVVGNDARWNAEHQLQHYGPERTVGCELRQSRYDELAESLGAHGSWSSAPRIFPPRWIARFARAGRLASTW